MIISDPLVGRSSKAYASAENFYEDLGDIAMDKGLVVHLVSPCNYYL